jgi:hypothetical protein
MLKALNYRKPQHGMPELWVFAFGAELPPNSIEEYFILEPGFI